MYHFVGYSQIDSHREVRVDRKQHEQRSGSPANGIASLFKLLPSLVISFLSPVIGQVE